MHIVFITQNYPPSVCGIGDHTYNLATTLAKRGYDIAVICHENVYKNDSVVLYPIIKKWDKEGYQIALKKIDELQADWVFIQYEPYSFHAKGVPYLMPFFVRKLKNKGHKTLVFFHEIAVKWTFSSKLIALSLAQRAIAQTMAFYAQHIVTSMAWYKKMLLPIFYKKIHIQPIGSNIITALQLGDTLKSNQIQGDEFWIACFGGDGVDKGYSILLDALKNLPFAKLLFIGKGENIKVYAQKNGLESQVVVTGILNTEGVYENLQKCNVFAMVHVDIRGGIGFKSGSLAAGFYAGLPILGVKGAITETDKLIHRENCFLISEPKPENFEKAIVELYTDKILLQKLSENSKKYSDKYMSWRVFAEQFEQLLRLNTPTPKPKETVYSTPLSI